MKRVMTRRLFLTYFIMTSLLIIMAAVAFLKYNIYTLKTNATYNLRQFGSSTSAQVDMQISSMDSISIDIASNSNFLALLNRLTSEGISRQQAIQQINQILIENYVNKTNIYRITVFTTQGDVFSTDDCKLSKAQVETQILHSSWINNVNLINDRKMLQGPHTDYWDPSNHVKVISLTRDIRNSIGVIGYIEIEQKVDVLESICENQWNGIPLKLAIIDGNNTVFYSNFNSSGTTIVNSIISALKEYSYGTIEDQNGILNISESNYNDWKIVLILDKSLLYAPLNNIVVAIIIVVICMLFLSALFIRIFTLKITTPINNFVKKISKFNLSNLDDPFEGVYESYEAQKLYDTFSQLVIRLHESIVKEKAAQQLQTKATFDMLQSKIGPHFLYNSLGSIANLCEDGDNISATDACYNLADILRYSVNYKDYNVKIRDEVENLKAYFSLMKCRYRQRLNFTIRFDKETSGIHIPKLTLQPIAENAIKYSLIESEQVNITISVELEDSVLKIQICDNGRGIDPETLTKINSSYEEYISDARKLQSYENLKFGGMGLLGTLLRQYLCFKGRFRYTIESNESSGTAISLYIKQ